LKLETRNLEFGIWNFISIYLIFLYLASLLTKHLHGNTKRKPI
jgi:hypothetical protein